MSERIDEALESMTRRQLEELRSRVDRHLQSCAIDGREGAQVYSLRSPGRGGGVIASIMLCPPCLERIRQPRIRATGEAEG